MPASAAPTEPGNAPVMVTRPAHDAMNWVQQLRKAGVNALALPLIDIAPVSEAAAVAALQRAWQALASYSACMFVSGNAVEHFFPSKVPVTQSIPLFGAIDNVAKSMFSVLPPGLRFMAPGPGTAAALRAAGVPDAQIDAPPADAEQFDSQALWRVVGQRDWNGRRVLVVRGLGGAAAGDTPDAAGRDWLTRQWQALGAQVDVVSVYERCVPHLSAAQLALAAGAAKDGSVWLFSSSQAVANLTGQADLQGVDWRAARAVATHPRIAHAAQAAGWGVVVESRPALQDILTTLRSIESKYP